MPRTSAVQPKALGPPDWPSWVAWTGLALTAIAMVGTTVSSIYLWETDIPEMAILPAGVPTSVALGAFSFYAWRKATPKRVRDSPATLQVPDQRSVIESAQAKQEDARDQAVREQLIRALYSLYDVQEVWQKLNIPVESDQDIPAFVQKLPNPPQFNLELQNKLNSL
jgi:hypothetical protein